jgi:hypothetical protein
MKQTEKLRNGLLNHLTRSPLPSLQRVWSNLRRTFEKNPRSRVPAIQPLLALRFEEEKTR